MTFWITLHRTSLQDCSPTITSMAAKSLAKREFKFHHPHRSQSGKFWQKKPSLGTNYRPISLNASLPTTKNQTNSRFFNPLPNTVPTDLRRKLTHRKEKILRPENWPVMLSTRTPMMRSSSRTRRFCMSNIFARHRADRAPRGSNPAYGPTSRSLGSTGGTGEGRKEVSEE